MNIQQYKNLSDYTTMRLGGEARYLVEAATKNDIIKAVDWARKEQVPFKVIGGGSNLIVTDTGFNGLIIHNKIRGIVATETDDNGLIISAGAGENWDELVAYSVQFGLTGIEALSLIPGTVGATPVQNVGAYGQEVSQTLYQVEAFDTQANEFVVLDNDACEFGYRDSVFKASQKDRYIITGVSFKLYKGQIEPPLYRALEEYLNEHEITDRSPDAIRNAVMSVRTVKLPDPEVLANTGSFFKNPVVSNEKFEELKKQHPDIPGFHTHDGMKVPAGWLLEQAGFKNYDHGNGMATHEQHALVIVNKSATSYTALAELKEHLVSTVSEMFGVELTQEPETLGL